ncbi:MAG: Rieske (2Fe-2S) iron-sulfur domain protein [Acidobacteria bacterium]|nr:Rieske (2Fe-2S) iron-sulfur domain protein [Acidobacteriota bacterium]
MPRDLSFTVAEDIREARTLPARVYSDPAVFDVQRDRVFARSWQLVGDADQVKVPGQVRPVTFLEGILPEPLLLTRDAEDEVHCLSNVCTHRGTLVCEGEAVLHQLRCRYHGRRFALDGRFLSMPEFDGARDFPTAADSLARLPLGAWGKLLFAALDPAAPLDDCLAPVRERCGWMPVGEAVFDPGRSRHYHVRANWALYCDNYLEGFHIPYVHASLADALDYSGYRTELFAWSSLQVGIARGDEDVFDLPPGSPDAGQRVAAYYFWLYPNLMLNVYPWGISVNVVKPLAVDQTRVTFLSYVWDAARLDRGAGAGLDRVEREDESVVESVQKGVRSRLYDRGRYSPSREQGVHHFHRLLAHAINS